MRNYNSMDKAEYVLTSLFYYVISMLWYRILLFISLQGYTAKQSRLILWITAAVFVTLGIICTFNKRRNNVSLFVNILLPCEIYAIVSYWPYRRKLIISVLMLAAVLMALYMICVLSIKVKKHAPKKKSYINRLKHSALGCRTLMAVCLLIFVVPLALSTLFGVKPYKTSVTSVNSVAAAEEWTVKNNIDVVKLLEDDKWDKLNTQQKLDVLGVITNIEIRYLGITHEVYLCADILEDNVLAQYDSKAHEVVIDIEHLNNDSAAEVLHSHLHEMYHVYQHAQVDVLNYVPEEYRSLLMFNRPNQYAEEFGNYIDGNDDYWGYSQQMVEIAADSYAYDAVPEYYELIEKYTSVG